MIRTATIALLALGLAGCADNSARFLIDPPPQASALRARVSTVEVLDVSLPAYASAVEIAAQEKGGALRNLDDALWADDPVRGVTTALASSLAAASTATVAPEPWPLAEPAQVRVSVRVERMLAGENGSFQLSGLYAIASPDGVIRERLERFDISVPLAGSAPGDVAAASGAAIADLAARIARSLAR